MKTSELESLLGYKVDVHINLVHHTGLSLAEAWVRGTLDRASHKNFDFRVRSEGSVHTVVYFNASNVVRQPTFGSKEVAAYLELVY
jgi:hypothetical protein